MHEPRNKGGDQSTEGYWLAAGPIAFGVVLALPTPADLGWEGKATLAVAAWMATWWLTVATRLAVTALIPLVAFPVLGVASPLATAAPYADPVIFLFMGGFFIAAAMKRWDLHRRVALGVVAATGTLPYRLVGGFMVACAGLSMWMSNTAAVLLMMPIGAAILRTLDVQEAEAEAEDENEDEDTGDGPVIGHHRNLGVALMLGIAYAGSIGGIATLIGTPPNAVLAGVARQMLDLDISFARWMAVGLPLSAAMLAICWGVLCFVLFPLSTDPLPGAGEALAKARAALGRWSRPERAVAAVFLLAGLAWVFRAPKEIGGFSIPGIQSVLPQVGDATIAIAAALVLFLWPARDDEGVRTTVLDWRHAASIPWDILVLFGGGLSLAFGFESSGLTTWLGGKLAVLAGLPNIAVIAAVAALFVFVTEVTSNTATASLGLPVVAGLGAAVGTEPLALMAAAAMGASMAFMLPVATPPNAIVFGTGYIGARDMRRAGIWLNFASIVAITIAVNLGFL